MIKSFLAFTAILALPAFAVAQQGGGSEQERAACAPDVKRFCVQVVDQGDLMVLSCLQQNRAKISPACNKVLVSHGQ
jgi:hypothetical protein